MQDFFDPVMSAISLDIPVCGSGPVRGGVTADGPILGGITATMPVKGV